jgi:AraC family transcriptional activator of pobA
MLEDVINIESDEQFMGGINIYIIKRNIAKSQDESFTANSLKFLLIKSGRFKIKIKEIVQNLSAHDLLILPKESYCVFTKIEDKLQFFLMTYSSEQQVFKNELNYETKDFFYHLEGKEPVKITLDKKDYLVLSLIYKLLHSTNNHQASSDFDFELQRLCLKLFLFELKLIYFKYLESAPLQVTCPENLVVKFLSILSIHCRKHHNVKFYAGVLFITPNHLNKTVKQVTGKPAKKIIIEAILAESIGMLEDSKYTIAEIAEELDFTSVSDFSRFFKKFILFTPSEYRSNAIERFKSR